MPQPAVNAGRLGIFFALGLKIESLHRAGDGAGRLGLVANNTTHFAAANPHPVQLRDSDRATRLQTGFEHASAMLTVQQVARLLNCSVRHVYRLADAGHMPRPVRLGALVRWNHGTIEQWISAGCPAVKGGRG